MKALILDYGTGNIQSLRQLLLSFFDYVDFSRSPSAVSHADLLVLPGVGSAITACTSLKHADLKSSLINRYEKQMPIVGICLGAQLMTSYLDESTASGLNFIGGKALIIQQKTSCSYNIGWRSLNFDQLKTLGLSKHLSINSSFYFNHQYAIYDYKGRAVLTKIENHSIPAIVIHENCVAIQFHPEKSQADGFLLMKNILKDYYAI